MPAGNVNLHAEWSATVTYLDNSASSGTAPTDATFYTQNQSATAASNSGTLARTGFTFGGWNTAANGSGTSYAPGSGSIEMNSGNVTLYAKWTATVTYLANSATSGTVPTDGNTYTQNQSATAANNTGSLEQTGFIFSGWNTAADGSGTTYAAGSGNIPMSGGDVTLYAKWTNTFTLTYTAGVNGSITGTSPQIVASGGNGVAVTAVADAGYRFVYWSDASTSNPRQDLAVSGDITVTANFAIDTYTLTYTAGANGSITGTSPQSVASGGNGTAVTAVPNANYHFVNWSDSSTANPRTDSNVTTNVSVTANFAIDTYTDWALANSVAGGVNGDSNNDGVQNGVAYFMGVTGQTTNPGLNASNQVTWPVNPNYQGSFEVQISSDLIIWTPASPQPTPSAGNLTYTLPSGLGKQFVRLVVTPN
jgi:uncharacterized repeat protein (TIGR02543 family)